MKTKELQNAVKLKDPGTAPGAPRDFRLYLQGELIRRCKTNPRYSLRSFAQLLKMDHSTLSQFLRGKRKVSDAIQFRLGRSLGLGPIELEKFFGANPIQKGSHPASYPSDADAYELTLDMFQVIADWYHYAIFELATVRDFNADSRWIAKVLGISAHEAHAAIERLKRLGLIQVDSDGKWTQGKSLITTTGNPFTDVAFRKLQAQVLEMGLKALEAIPMEHRDQSSMTMAIPSRLLPEAKQKIKKFRRELCEFLQDGHSDRDSVYQLGVSLYPLTRIQDGSTK